MFASKKRGRDEDEYDILELDHASKVMKQEKQCTLPFRTSPNTKHVRAFSRSPRPRPAPLFTQTITPAESSEEENSPPFAPAHDTHPLHSFQPTRSTIPHNEDMFDSDMDMVDSQPITSPRLWPRQPPLQTPNASPCTITPPQPAFKEPFSGSPDSVFGGRLPTPIYGHFQRSIDSRMDVGEDTGNPLSRSQNEIDYEMYARRRRLPTPIDEDEPMDSPLSPTPGGLFRRFAIADEQQYSSHSPTKNSDGLVAPPRGTRLSFSMGIRADCELCRNRVPGHSNHIFRS